ncbi:hypothetical protein BLNAU_20461 [Blattamonas nauphoetae]|uniref:Uncharacterized protein n=1 Tax=Blattamonas nauphoetae TaxID=2049346 RepID=A0ABQ9WYK5_9EUKA|nr:hypothetical protein BLNAU_20461 [Blattamonas nauphoetae]
MNQSPKPAVTFPIHSSPYLATGQIGPSSPHADGAIHDFPSLPSNTQADRDSPPPIQFFPNQQATYKIQSNRTMPLVSFPEFPPTPRFHPLPSRLVTPFDPPFTLTQPHPETLSINPLESRPPLYTSSDTEPFGLYSLLPNSTPKNIAPALPQIHQSAVLKFITPLYTQQPMLDSSLVQPPHVLHAFQSNPSQIDTNSLTSLSDHSLFYIFYHLMPQPVSDTSVHLTQRSMHIHTAQRLVLEAFTLLLKRDWTFLRNAPTDENRDSEERDEQKESNAKTETKKERRRQERLAAERGRACSLARQLEQYGLFVYTPSAQVALSSKKKKNKKKDAVATDLPKMQLFDVSEWSQRDLEADEEEEIKRLIREADVKTQSAGKSTCTVLTASRAESLLRSPQNAVPPDATPVSNEQPPGATDQSSEARTQRLLMSLQLPPTFMFYSL